MKLGKTVAKMSKLPSISRSPSSQLLKVSGPPLYRVLRHSRTWPGWGVPSVFPESAALLSALTFPPASGLAGGFS